MRINNVKKLHRGDEVYWNDPDKGTCSRILKILKIEVTSNVVHITEEDGSEVECYARELS